MRKYLVVSIWLAALVAASVSLCYAQATTADVAATKAAAFATALNLPWGDETQTVLRQNVNQARKAEWVTTYGSFSSIGVDQRTGAVVSAVDYSEVMAHTAAQAPAKLDQAAAIARAQDIITRAGLITAANLGTPEVKLQQDSQGVWRFAVKYPCVYQGIPYEYGCVTVLVAAEDGKLLALSSAINVPVPASTTATVDEKTATTSALGYAAKLTPDTSSATASAKLMIVAPNSYWNAWGLGAKEDSTVARTAWVVTATQNGAQLIFWIDAADGRLLGGTQSMGAVVHPASALLARRHGPRRPPPAFGLRPPRRRPPPRHHRPPPLPPPPPLSRLTIFLRRVQKPTSAPSLDFKSRISINPSADPPRTLSSPFLVHFHHKAHSHVQIIRPHFRTMYENVRAKNSTKNPTLPQEARRSFDPLENRQFVQKCPILLSAPRRPNKRRSHPWAAPPASSFYLLPFYFCLLLPPPTPTPTRPRLPRPTACPTTCSRSAISSRRSRSHSSVRSVLASISVSSSWSFIMRAPPASHRGSTFRTCSPVVAPDQGMTTAATPRAASSATVDDPPRVIIRSAAA